MRTRITRDEEAINLYFADYPYEVSGEFADSFIVDYDLDDRIISLEILCDERRRAHFAETPLVAFGVLGTALAGLGWRYKADVLDTGQDVIDILCRQLETMIKAVGLNWQVAPGLIGNPFDIAIRDDTGDLLIAVDLKSGSFQRGKVQQYAKALKEKILPDNPGAIGICVFIDETGQGYRNPPVTPGCWIDWPEAKLPNGSHVWAHIAIIPPHDCVYPWLPKSFLPSRNITTS